jgi:hypothetical protein
MYCKDLKQMMDERGLDKEWKRVHCPDPVDEHDALADALWNFKLFNAIISSGAGIHHNTVSISDIREIIELSKLTINELRTRNRNLHGAYNGKELTKPELIFQLAFEMDAPLK